MTPAEAARYEKYWGQGHANVPHNTRPREFAAPGTKSIKDPKLSNTGEVYTRETIYDDFGGRKGGDEKGTGPYVDARLGISRLLGCLEPLVILPQVSFTTS